LNTFECKILSCTAASRDIYIVSLEADHILEFKAGQYLELMIPGESYCYFSIANAPGSKILELHVQSGGEETASSRIIEYLLTEKKVDIQLPMGDCTLDHLAEETGPLLLIAAGTGFSQVKSISEAMLSHSLTRSVHLYWSARTVSGLYLSELPEMWHQSDCNFHFSAIVSEHNDWQDKQSLLFNAVVEDFPDLSKCQAVCCGSPEMVYATLDKLTEHSFRTSQMISDVFSHAPRT